MITYEQLICFAPGDVASLNVLLAQLSGRGRKVDEARLGLIAMFFVIFVGRDEYHGIKAMATLSFVHSLSGSTSWLEDVVVDKSLRGQHVGEAIVQRVIEYARNERHLERIELTSKPERMAANRLYQKLGFKLRNSNYYRMDL